MYNDSLTDSILDIRNLAEMADNALSTVVEFEEGDADKDDAEEALELLDTLKAFLSELGHSDTANYEVGDELRSIGDYTGVTLISDDYMEEYAEEWVKDCGYLPADLSPLIANNINWEGIAEELRADMTSADLAGSTYYLY